jgi:hypothetical protein
MRSGCYAAQLGGWFAKMSREYAISSGVLELLYGTWVVEPERR